MARKATRNAQGAGSLRQRADGTWEARYTIGRDPGTGKQVRKSVYGKTQKEARQRLTAALAAIDTGDYKAPEKMTVGQWLDIWTAEYLGGVSGNTRTTYKRQTENHIKPALGAVRLQLLDASRVQRFYNSLLEPHGSAAALSSNTARNVAGVLHKALNQAVKNGLIRYNPADACTLPRVERKEITPLDGNEITAFLEAIKGERFQALFTVTLFTGMREGEALGLMWDCVDFERGAIRIDKQLLIDKEGGGCRYVLAPPKGGKARTITPAPWVMRLLRVHRSRQGEMRLKAGAAWEDSGLVFPDELGHHLRHLAVYKAFKRVASAIGCPDARFHDLRHSYAVAAIRAGDDIKTIQGNLGHATASFTLDVYGHVTEEMKRDSAARMEEYIAGVLGL